ncbi:hypothetical protein KVT40_003795 [Elsinoe batatas]|uniref:Uncharacterized protein n=1 Tax=Elsinoe batatas TaxID=2601811 RepID=A0A8K0L2J1_9PEZI|nr:hypothetical protein KVT40_003795 [Elsinoe batatas]
MALCFRLDMRFPDSVQATYLKSRVYRDDSTGDEPMAEASMADTVIVHLASSDEDSSIMSSSTDSDSSGSSRDSDDSSSLDEFSSKDQRKIVARDELAFYHAAGSAHFESDAVLTIMDRLAGRPPVLYRPGTRYAATPIYIHRSVGGVC